MKILVVGSGGREHALCWALAKEATVICAPGNPGIADEVQVMPVPTTDHAGLVQLAQAEAVDLVVIGPEDPLIAGLADVFREAGLAVFGPGAEAARLEGSKAFSKAAMAAAGVPTARFSTFTEAEAAKEFARRFYAEGAGVVVKASGNALGKGAIVCEDQAHAEETIESLLVHRSLGEAGAEIVVEERLHGPEFSLLTLVSGEHYYSLPVAQDHKRAHDGDQGPNTGGMGTYSPVAAIPPSLVAQAEAESVVPLLQHLTSNGIDFRGVLFSGLLVHQGRPYCLEYNVRFGDPETQSVLSRLGPGLADALMACAQGQPIPAIPTLDTAAVTVVVASRNYPDAPEKGFPIRLPDKPSAKIFHAGTALKDGLLVNSGGRVFGVTGTGATVAKAKAMAYETVDQIHFEGAWARHDIG